MKTILYTLGFLLFLSASANQISAQCVVSNFIIQNERPAAVQLPGSCTIIFDMTFNIESNNGNKFIFIHEWISSQYPDYFQCVNGHASGNGAIHSPRGADLVNAFMNVGIDNSGTVPVILTTYNPDPTVVMTTVGSIIKIVLPDGSANFTLQNVTVTLPVSCGTPVIIAVDFWSTQSSSAQVAHCVNCHKLYSQYYMSVTGFVNCSTLTYNALLTNNTAIALDGFYNVFADINFDGYFTPTTDTLLSGPVSYNIQAGVGSTSLISGSIPAANLNQDIFLVFTQTTGLASDAARVIRIHSTQCAPLPVLFSSFTVNRTNNTNVLLRWETATEINNSGFDLQRNKGDNRWQSVGFIASLSPNGNSTASLTYTYTDLNAGSLSMQYRIRQIDIDGRSKFSEIRTVPGMDQNRKLIVYPNPSEDGRINLFFENLGGKRDITLTDISGRIIRQWRNSSTNNIPVTNLQPGIYILQVTDQKTGQKETEKIMINQR
ncbi:MAG: T9SS type A sorting domain-containing protein [Chitinophagaceae bacterium]